MKGNLCYTTEDQTTVFTWEKLQADLKLCRHRQEEDFDDKVLLSIMPEAKDEKGNVMKFLNDINMIFIKWKF